MQNTIFITGAASGIGRASARLFARKGWRIGLYDIDAAGLQTVQEQIGAHAIAWGVLDVTDADAVATAMREFAEYSGGQMHVLFNCAGLLQVGRFADLSLDAYHRMMAVNMQGVVNCIYHALPLLKQTPGACIVSMGSASGLFGTPDFAVYSASKFFIRGLTEALSIELEKEGIRVCDLMPPFVDTPMLRPARPSRSMDRLGVRLKPEQVAAAVWKAVHGRRQHDPVEPVFTFLYKISGWLPDALARRVMKLVSGY